MIKYLLGLCYAFFLWTMANAQVADTLHHTKDSLRKSDLEIEHIHLQDVLITGKMTSLSGSLHRLTQAQLNEQKGNPLAESLSQIAGLSTIGMGNSIVKPVINGLHSNRILIINQDVRQEGQQWGIEHAPEIDPFVADRLEVIKGAQGVRYGADALGGVVLISANDININKSLGGKIDIVGQSNGWGANFNGELEGTIKSIPNLGWRVQSSQKKTGNYRSADYYLGNTGIRELNYSGNLQYQHRTNRFEAYFSHFGTNLGIFRGAHIATAEDIEARIAEGRPFETYDFTYAIQAPRQMVTHDLAKLQWKRQLADEKSLEVLYAFQHNHRKEFDLRRVASDETPMADMVLTTQQVDVTYKNGGFSLGAQGTLQVNNNTPGTGTTPIIPNFDSQTWSLYGLQQLHFGKFHTEGGLRYDYKHLDMAGYRYDYAQPNADGSLNQYLMTDDRQFHNLSGTLGLLYHILPHFNWKSNVGLAWRAPSANELYSDGVHHGSGSYEVGNKNLASEKGVKWVNSLLWNTDRWQVTVDVYAQMLYDYIYAQPHPDSVRQTIRGTFPLFSYEQHNAFFYGADVSSSFSINEQFRYQLNASLVRAKNITLNNYLPYIPSDRGSQTIQWSPSMARANDTYIKLTHRFVNRQTRYDEGTDYAPPPPAYHLFDLIVSKRIAIPESKSLQILLAANNLFNTAYKDYMDRFRYFAHQMGRNLQIKLSYQF